MAQIMRPLTYCQYRPGGDGVCNQFAAELLEGMPMCGWHLEHVRKAIDEEEVTFVDTVVVDGS